jgi:hypothetical protein
VEATSSPVKKSPKPSAAPIASRIALRATGAMPRVLVVAEHDHPGDGDHQPGHLDGRSSPLASPTPTGTMTPRAAIGATTLTVPIAIAA